jgi:hypothetical protein
MIGEWILFIGGMLVTVGAVLWLLESLGVPLGCFPGDIRMNGEGWSFRFPVVTCIVLSIVVTNIVECRRLDFSQIRFVSERGNLGGRKNIYFVPCLCSSECKNKIRREPSTTVGWLIPERTEKGWL